MSHAPRPRPTKRAPASARSTKPPSKTPRIRLLLVDDHPVVREGLRSCLALHSQIQIVGEAASGEDALLQAKQLKPDLILMDINLPGISGLDAAVRLRQLVPATKVLFLSVHDRREYVQQVMRSGARGYVLKDAPPAELLQAIEAVQRGDAFFSPRVAAAMIETAEPPAAKPRAGAALLSAREREVLALLVTGLSNKEISEELGVAFATIKTLRARTMKKLDLHSIAELTQFALAHGIRGPSPESSRSR